MVLTLLPSFSTNLIIERQDRKRHNVVPSSKTILLGSLDHQAPINLPGDTAEYPVQLQPGWAT